MMVWLVDCVDEDICCCLIVILGRTGIEIIGKAEIDGINDNADIKIVKRWRDVIVARC